MDSSLLATFGEFGYAGPVRIFDRSHCALLLEALGSLRAETEWAKGNAALWPAYFEVGSAPAIVEHVAEILGDDVMLWGASLVRRQPGRLHPWHTDVETSSPDGRSVSVWIGLENTSRSSSPMVIPSSHRFGASVQECAVRAGRTREDMTDDDVLRWAAGFSPESHIMRLDMSEGDALFFDGRLWHATHNTGTARRTALLLQYATPDTPIRMPLNDDYSWPFNFRSSPRPPCVMVRGSSAQSRNRMVRPPAPHRATSTTWIKRLQLPLEEDRATGWRPYPIFRGSSALMPTLWSHVSVLSAGHSPHEPHAHIQEELLIVLSGGPELIFSDGPDSEPSPHPARRGNVAYYPAGRLHTIRNPGPDPAIYLMIKWTGKASGEDSPRLSAGLHDAAGAVHLEATQEHPFVTKRLFEGPTKHLRKLHCHVSSLRPGGGYEAHIDAYDLAILVLDGTIEILGNRLGANDLVFVGAGEPHGMKNVGLQTATYIVFEFHGDTAVSAERPSGNRVSTSLTRLARRLARRGVKRLQAISRVAGFT